MDHSHPVVTDCVLYWSKAALSNRFVDIQWPMSVVQCSSREAVEAVSQRSQRIISIHMKVDILFIDVVGEVDSVQNKQSRTKYRSFWDVTKLITTRNILPLYMTQKVLFDR